MSLGNVVGTVTSITYQGPHRVVTTAPKSINQTIRNVSVPMPDKAGVQAKRIIIADAQRPKK